MRMIITGATGSLGAYLTRWFSKAGHQVLATGRTGNPPARLLEFAEYIQRDITRPITLPNTDVCVHCAALADDKAKVADLHQANVEGTRNVIAAAVSAKIFIHVSSSSVYPYSDLPLTEDMLGESPGKRLSLYGYSKWQSEDVVATLARNESRFILRPRGIYGAGDKVLLPRLLKLMRNSQLIKPGDMNVRLSLTHFQNFALAVERCIQSHKPGTRIYNVADDGVYILSDIVRKLFTSLHTGPLREKKVPLAVLKCMAMLGVGEVTPLFVNTVSKHLVLDTSKIKRELNYTPAMTLDSSLKEVKDWVNAIGGVEVLKGAAPELAWKV